MNPQEYESTVRDFLRRSLTPADTRVHHGKKHKGKRSGYEHEIDLSFELDVAGTQVLVLVECKAYSRPVSVDDILEFGSRIEDIAAHKGILVSTSGYTSGARKVAMGKGIALVRAVAGEWAIIGRFTGPPPPRLSSRFFMHDSAALAESAGGSSIVFAPINEVDMRSVCNFDAWVNRDSHETKRSRDLHPMLEIVEPGSEGSQTGQILLYRGTDSAKL